jgi:hypothetical protein
MGLLGFIVFIKILLTPLIKHSSFLSLANVYVKLSSVCNVLSVHIFCLSIWIRMISMLTCSLKLVGKNLLICHFLKLFITNIEICGWVFSYSFECSCPDSQTAIWRRIYWGMHAWRLYKTWIHNLQEIDRLGIRLVSFWCQMLSLTWTNTIAYNKIYTLQIHKVF